MRGTPPEHPPELVGATKRPLRLGWDDEKVSFDVGRPTGPAKSRGAANADRVYLTVEGVAATAPPDVTYSVFVNLPDGDDPDNDPETFYAGNLSLFGAERAGNVQTDRPGGHGLQHSFDITALVAELNSRNLWDPKHLTVTFAPVLGRGRARRTRGASSGDSGAEPPVTVGRVGLYIQ
jgi:tyrosinase